jgi:hypothetical protein
MGLQGVPGRIVRKPGRPGRLRTEHYELGRAEILPFVEQLVGRPDTRGGRTRHGGCPTHDRLQPQFRLDCLEVTHPRTLHRHAAIGTLIAEDKPGHW